MAITPVLPKLVGERVKRREDPRLIQGRATYVDDVALVGMQHLAFKRSDVAHGRIRSIDTSAAEAMDGVEAVFTGAQIAELLAPMPIATPFPSPPHRAVAADVVRYAGEPVAVVAATTGDIASYYTATATLSAEKEAEILARVAGVVETLSCEEGDVVAEGDELLRIDNDEYQFRLQQAEASRADLESRVERLAKMREQDLVSAEEYETLTNNLAAARAAYVSAILMAWAGYRFSIGPLVTEADVPLEGRPEAQGDFGGLYRAAYKLARAPVYPAPEFFQGLAMLRGKNQAGQKAYLLGDVRQDGWWYFFPVALAVKTPIPFLLLFGLGTAAALRLPGPSRRRALAPAAAAAAILLVALPSRINIGLRHVLPMYPLMAVMAGAGAVALWRWRPDRRLGPAAVALLVGWQVIAGLRVHPDYIAYFNEAAGRHPERILVDSDLDNGQDLWRLADTLRARGVKEVALAYAGSATVAEHGMPTIRWLEPHRPDTGWVAASLWSLKLGSLNQPGHDDFAWLERYRPVAQVGRSIRLYYVPSVPADSRR